MANKFKTITIYWRIENISKFFFKSQKTLRSPLFKNVEFSDMNVRLGIKAEINKNGVSILYLDICQNTSYTDEIDFGFKIMDAKKRVYVFGKKSQTFTGKEFVSTPILLEENFKRLLYTDGNDFITVICELKSKKYDSTAMKIHFDGKTVIDFESQVFYWNLRKIDPINRIQHQVISSKKYTFELSLNTSKDEEVILEIEEISHPRLPHLVVYTDINLLDKDDHIKENLTGTCTFEENKSPTWVFPLKLKKEDMNKFKILFSIKLTTLTFMEMQIIEKVKIEAVECNVDENSIRSSDEFQDMLTDADYHDVKFCVGDQVFYGQKRILSKRSKTFESLFKNASKDKTSVLNLFSKPSQVINAIFQEGAHSNGSVFNVKDIEVSIFERMMYFMHARQIKEIDCSNAMKLIKAAKTCEEPSLVDECTKILMTFLTVENAGNIIVIAEELCIEDLRNAAKDIIEKEASVFFTSDQWVYIKNSNSKLAVELSDCFIQQHSKKPRYS